MSSNGSRQARGCRHGFTLIEMSVVVAIIGILYFTVVPLYGTTIQRARETALRENLQVLRKTIDLYFKDREVWPADLATLVKDGYLRAVPVDPLTGRADTWVTVPSNVGAFDVFDVHSGAAGTGLDGTPYATW
ncbi:MAG: putative secretion system X protein GspG-like 2 [Candidatus Ozemobacter sibiricus]|uniref:Putative secretion system X protein GspG-like 2 n=1 Tax=Candidatus Ozemobacter sibiricus TaxID=2268124 RepID=A0A367ZSP3_9BACT|nr:MAG: putative secretion system X protein GspG-like 2 [Candidatus Ozemobacter sibiricus]